MEYYKKIDKSTFDGKITIPREYESYFINSDEEQWGSSRKISLKFKGKVYSGKYSFVLQSSGRKVFQIFMDKSLVQTLKKEFIQSYFAIESQKILKKEGKFHTELIGGNQEVLIFKPLNNETVELLTFIKVQTAYDNLFKHFVDSNVFGWLSKEKNNQIVTKYTKWFESSEINKHFEQNHVVYYLLDENKKEIYIGSAKKLGDRVKLGRKEIPGWNKFMYAIIHPDYHKDLKEIEYHTIMSFAAFLNNKGNKSNCGISDYTLVNKDYKFYRD